MSLLFLSFSRRGLNILLLFGHRFAHSIECPQSYLQNASQMIYPDTSSLFSSLQNFGKGGTMLALYDNFCTLASAWDLSAPETVSLIQDMLKHNGKKHAASVEASMKKDNLKFRFLDAVYDLQKCGIIKVTNNGKSFQKILSAWVYDL